MRENSPHLLIQGNFAPAGNSRLLRMSARILSVLTVVMLFGALVMYGVKVHFEETINRAARETREMNEQNKELQVRLNHIRSYKNVEAAAAKVPHLHLAETVLEVPTGKQTDLPPMPPEKREFPRVYGY